MGNTSAAERTVREQLAKAQRLALEYFDSPSEVTVMAIFRRLCDETDLPSGSDVSPVACVVH